MMLLALIILLAGVSAVRPGSVSPLRSNLLSLPTTSSSSASATSRNLGKKSYHKNKLAPKKRECKTKVSGSKLKSNCKATSKIEDGSEIKDGIKFEVSCAEKGAAVKVEYEQKLKTEQNETESETQFEVYFDSIIEYVKNSSGSMEEAYDWDLDEIVQTVELNSWQDIQVISEDEMKSVFSCANDEELVHFFFTITHSSTEDDLVTPNSVKIDFRLDGFPWVHNNSYVALLSTVETKRKIKVEYDKSKKKGPPPVGRAVETQDVVISFDDLVDRSTFTPFGVYEWAEEAEATGQTILSIDANETAADTGTEVGNTTNVESIRVVATSPVEEPIGSEAEEKKAQSTAFSFVGEAAHLAQSIYWDPSAGVGYGDAADSGGCALSIAMGFLATGVIVTLII